MSFMETEFPKTISYKAQGGPGFNTTVNSGFSGFEQRNQNWQTVRGQWTVSLETPGPNANVNPQTYIDMLTSFFLNVGGKANAFRLKDHKDFTNGAATQAIGLGDGTTGHFQMVKNYPSGTRNYQRIISKPVTSLVVDYLGNALLDTIGLTLGGTPQPKNAGYTMGGSSKYSVDETTGTVSFGNPALVTITRWDTDTDGNVRLYYTQVGGTTIVKNEQICITGGSQSAFNGVWKIIGVGTGWLKIPLVGQGAGTGTTSNCTIGWSKVVVTGIASVVGSTVVYNVTTITGLAPAVGQRFNVTGLSGSGSNGSYYITAVGAGTVTVSNSNGPTAGANAGLASTDWVPASGAGLINTTFQFHMPVRFDTDELAIQLEESDVAGGHPIVSWNAITLREVRIPAGTSQG